MDNDTQERFVKIDLGLTLATEETRKVKPDFDAAGYPDFMAMQDDGEGHEMIFALTKRAEAWTLKAFSREVDAIRTSGLRDFCIILASILGDEEGFTVADKETRSLADLDTVLLLLARLDGGVDDDEEILKVMPASKKDYLNHLN